MTKPGRIATALLALLPLAQAEAHVGSGGIVDSYGGLLHPYTEPVHIISIMALGFMLTQQGRNCPPGGWVGFCLAALVGLVASTLAQFTLPPPVLLVVAMLLGVLVAASPSLPVAVCISLSVITGFSLGVDSLAGSPDWWTSTVSILSTVTGLAIALLIVMGWGDYFKKDWQQIGIRILGSWITASALLVLVLDLAGT